MNGQQWMEGDEIYHGEIISPTLLLYGGEDKLVSLSEEIEMRDVSSKKCFICEKSLASVCE